MNTGVFCLRAIAVVFLALATATASAESGDSEYNAPTPGTYDLPVIKPAADGALVDSAGNSTRLSDVTAGKITVLSFIYTRCGDAKACPYAASVLNSLHLASREDALLAKNLRLVSMSFDPEHDTPKRMAEYASIVRDSEDGCSWQFVAPRSLADTAPILRAYGQAVNRKADPRDGGGPLNHTLRVYLIDPQRRIRNIYSSGTLDSRLVLADVRTLLLEQNTTAARADGHLP